MSFWHAAISVGSYDSSVFYVAADFGSKLGVGYDSISVENRKQLLFLYFFFFRRLSPNMCN